MLARIRKAQEENEGGFTLIELLVVIIIIGILAAIAIPVFLNQRQKGYDAATKSDIRNLATLEETYLTDNTAYTSVVSPGAGITTFKKSANVTTVEVGSTAADRFCIVGTSASGKAFLYDSANGGVAQTSYASAAAAKTACGSTPTISTYVTTT